MPMTLSPDDQDLVTRALTVRQRAYAPYSNFPVGAALRTAGGQIFLGTNVENASYGLCICAERSAMCSAVAAGHTEVETIAIASRGAATPCGACRQFLAEWGTNPRVLLVDADATESIRQFQLRDLLPNAFDLDVSH